MTNFECRVTDEEVRISFDRKTIRLPISEAESLHHELARHVFYGEGGFDLMGIEIEMEAGRSFQEWQAKQTDFSSPTVSLRRVL